MKKLLVVFLVLGLSFPSLSQYSGSFERPSRSIRKGSSIAKINNFQRQALEHIADGILNGSITANEAKRLLDVAERIEKKENRYLRNRKLTSREFRELSRDLEALDRMIARERRNRDRSSLDRNRF